MGNNLNNPHDKFFKASFGRVDLAKNFLINYLPEEIDEVIDYRQMQMKNTTFVDEKLADYYSDLLYQTSIEGEDAYLYFLFEHKSYLDRWAVLQLLNYMLRIWLKEKAKSNFCKLPIIIPILFYHGKRSSNIKINFREYFNNKEQFERFIPSFEVLFYDFSLSSNTKIIGDFKLQYVLKLMKLIQSNQIRLIYQEITDYIIKLAGNEHDFVLQGIKYIFEVQREFDLKEVARAMERKGIKEADQIVRTMAEKLRQEGREEGMKEGRQEELQRISIKLIKRKFSLDIVPEELVKNIEKAEISKLESLAENIFDISSIDEINKYLS